MKIMKYLGIAVLVLIALGTLGAVGSALNLITIPWLRFDSQVQLNRDVITKTYDADNALYNYHWFQERSEAIKALATTIEQSKDQLTAFEKSAGDHKDWTFEDKTEDNRLRAVVSGQTAQYNSLVGEYNARSQEADRNIFQNDLPLFFNLK